MNEKMKQLHELLKSLTNEDVKSLSHEDSLRLAVGLELTATLLVVSLPPEPPPAPRIQ